MRPNVLKLTIAGVIAFVVSMIVFMPARVLGYFLPPTVAVGTLTGSIWNGKTDSLAINGRALGALQWNIRPLHLFRGKLALDGQLTSAASEVRGRFALGMGTNIEAWNVELRWPLSALPFNAVPPGWNGDLQATLREVVIRNGKVQTVLGIVDARNLQKAPPDTVAIGAYRLTFDEKSRQNDKLVGRLQDLEGPMQVTGTLTLGATRDFTLEGMVATRPNAPEAIMNTLRFLGEPDGQGRRPFTVGGTY